MSKEDPGCIHSAGALKDGKLSEETYNQIVQNVIDAGDKGFAAVHPELPCADKFDIPAAPGLVPKDLHDKEKYPDFHKNVMGNFEQIALALDVKGNFSLPFPLWDPFAIGLKLDLDVSFDLPALPTLVPPTLALALNIKIPDLPKIAALFSIPPIPPINVKIPTIDLSINLPPDWLHFFKFVGWPLSLPDLVLKLAVPDINFVIGMLKVPPDLCPVVQKVVESQMFGPTNDGDVAKQIAIAELSVFTAKCTTIAVTSLLVGDGGPSGVTGNLGTQYGFRKATPVKDSYDGKARNILIEAFKLEFGRDPTLKEVQFAQIIAKSENGYGKAWAKAKSEWPPQAVQSNNWGNIHGKGDAGSFTHVDYNEEGKPYNTSFAMYSSPLAGARALLSILYKKRPYILEALNKDKSLYKPIFLMSSRAVLGDPGYKTGKESPNAVVPMSKGGLTYYVAPPEIYLKNAKLCLKEIMKNVEEETDFDLEAKSNVPYDPAEADDSKNNGSASVAQS